MARALAFIETAELNQRGMLYVPQVTGAFVARYGFLKFPKESKDFDLGEGITFQQGKSVDGITIDKLTIYGGTILVETEASTEISKQILLEMFGWLRDELGATFNESQVRRWVYINQVLFRTDFPILAEFSKPVEALAEKTNRFVSEIFGEELGYQSQTIQIGHDPSLRKNGIAGFQIIHRGGVPYIDNRYYSEAPLPTDIHWELLEDFERDVLAGLRHEGRQEAIRGGSAKPTKG
jgi:hypothetical protein